MNRVPATNFQHLKDEPELLRRFREDLGRDKHNPFIQMLAVSAITRPFGSPTLQKLAARLVLATVGRLDDGYLSNPAVYACQVETASEEEFLKMLAEFLSGRLPFKTSFDDYALLTLTVFIQRAAKSKKVPRTSVLSLLFMTISIAQVRSEDLTHLLKGCLKALVCSDEEKRKLFCELFTELPPRTVAKYYLLAQLLPCIKEEQFIAIADDLEKELLFCAEDQMICSASSCLISALTAERLAFVDCIICRFLMQNSTAIRTNVLRCWVARLGNQKNGLELFRKIIEYGESILGDEAREIAELWPPSTADEYENLSCISADWAWREAETPTTLRDRAMTAMLATAHVALQERLKTKNKVWDPLLKVETLKQSLVWPLDSVRALGFSLLVANDQRCNMFEGSLDQPTATLAFIHENLTTQNSALEDAIRAQIKKLFLDLSIPEEEGWKESKISGTFKIANQQELDKVFEETEKLFDKSGSRSEEHCPQFSELATNLQQHGLTVDSFSKEVQTRLKSAAAAMSANEALGTSRNIERLWKAVLRTREKSIVDHGTELFAPLFLKDRRVIEPIFVKTIKLVVSPISSTRTLALSKSLWACCQISVYNFVKLWDQFEAILRDCFTYNPVISARVLKITKYFMSRELCPWSKDRPALVFLFKTCLSVAGKAEDFLTRSAARILFGFVANLIWDRRETCFYYELLVDDWKDVVKMAMECFSSEEPFSTEYRLLVLSFLCKYRLGTRSCYGKTELRICEKLTELLLAALPKAEDIRESRLILDCVAALVPYSEVHNLQNKLNVAPKEEGFYERQIRLYLNDSLTRLWSPSLDSRSPFEREQRIPTDILQSPYIQVVLEFGKILEDSDQVQIENHLAGTKAEATKSELHQNAYNYCRRLYENRKML
ncbi:unnamed protein product, partial [Mesorhabditis spiculigera]